MEPAIKQGLCTDCKWLGKCAMRCVQKGYVYYCEEYNNGESEVRRPLGFPSKISPTAELKKEENVPTGELKGLCSTCRNLADCLFNRPESGVWHCEEYC